MPKFLHTGHFSGSSTDLTLDGQLFLPSTTSDPGASPAISFDSGAGGIFYDSDDDHLWFRAGGGKRAYVSNAGIISQANVYSGSNSQFRNYAGVWAGTTGIAGNGFYFLNTANSNTTKAMELTSTGSIMTVNGEVRATKYVDKANTSYFINPKADSATADAAMLLGRVRIGSNEAGAISQFGVGGRTQIQTMNYKAGAYGADGQNNGITVLANDATISNSFMGTTALVLHNTGAISTKSLFRITRTSGRTSTPFSTGLGSYSVKFDIKGNGDVDVKGNIRTTQDIGRDDHNRIMFSTDNSIIYRVADSHRFRMDSDNLSPYADSSYDLGTNSVRWRNVYADTLYGDGSNLTNLPSGNTTTINNNANNRVITGSGTADTLEAESGLTFDGDILEITGSGTTTKRMKVSPGTDYGRAHIGRAALGKLGWDDHAGFSHEDHNSQNNYALLQDETGTTYINAAQNKTGYLRTNNQTRAYWTGSGFYSSIYYDSNDTNYYVNPNGASNINSLTVGEVVTSNHIYGRSVNNQYSLLYRFGGLFLTWDSDTYGTQLNHSITSTDNGAYSDSITINSYDKVRINIDSNNNDSASTFTVGHHGTGSSGYLLHLDESGHHTVTGSSRAPIFYDSNDTNYYVDPASTSVVNHMDMDTANTSGKFAVMSSGVHGTYDFYNNGTSYLNGAVIIDDALDLTGSNRALKIAGTTRINSVGDIIGTSYYVGSTNIVDTNRNLVNIAGITSTGNAVFGNSNTDKVVIHGHLGIGDDTYPKIAYPGQNALWGGSGSTTGQIVIDLPGTLGNYDMMYMEIDIYEYSGDAATKLIIGGHNWNSGGNSNTDTTQWYNVNVQVLGSLTKPVYFGRRNDGSNERRCIAIGETTSTWSYATVHVHKVHGAEFYGTAIDWVGDWNIAQTTSTSYFTKNPTTNFNDGGSQTFETNGIGEANHWFGSTSVRSPIFYDLDNTAYYADLAGATSINLAGRITGNSSQNRVKYSVWTGSTYGIGMKNGFDYGHIGSNEYAMTFQMNDDNSRGFWWGDTGHNDNQGAMSLTTNGRLVVANSISIGEGESVTSPSMETLFVGGDVLIDGGETTTLHVKCDNSGNAIIRAGGDSQGTGVFEVTQDGSYGGGMSYNGDASPTWASGETADHITFYRMDNNTRTEVFHYPYNSSVVNFNSTPTIAGSNIAKVSDIPTNNNQLTNGAGYLTASSPVPSHNHDDRYYTESEMQTFFDRGYIESHSASNLAVGWYTIATNTGDRALGEFQIWETDSGDHQSVIFSAAHHFGVDGSNDITILNQSRYSGTNFRYIRIKEAGTYDGAALQVYIDGTSNSCNVAIVGGNAQVSGWVIKDWIPDATDPGDLSSYNTFTEKTKVDLDVIVNGGMLTTGEIYASGQTSQNKVFHDNYHPNADKWTTARTITLGGDLSGSVSIDGSANVTLSGQVVNNSHTHDDRYIVKGGSWHGLNMPGSRHEGVSSAGGEFVLSKNNPNNGQMSVLIDGNYYSGENNGFYSLYSSNNYNAKSGFYADSSGNTQFSTAGSYLQANTAHGYIQIGPMNTSWAHIYTDRPNFYFNKELYVNGHKVFHNNFHPNADTLTTARTIAGTSFDGSANIDISYNNLTDKPTIPGDTNYYLDGITKLDNTLTFSVNGATNQTYTFGSNAFTSTTIPTHTSSLTNNSGFITASATVDKANGLAEVGYGSDEMTFQQLSSSFAGYTGGWANYFIGNHGNGSNYYNTVHIMPFWGTPKYSRLENNNLKGPFNYLTDETNHTTNYTLGAAKFQQHNNSNRYLIPSGTSLLDSINLYGSAPLSLTSRYGGFGDVCSYGGRMLGYSRGAAGAVLGVNKSGQVFEYEKIFTFKVSGNGWVNRSSNPFKILQAPGTDKMIIVDEFLVYIDYESGNGNTGLGYNGYLARVTDSAAYSIGFYANESGQSQSQASHGVSSNFYTLGIMPGGFMNNTTDRGYYRDVPVHQSALIANRSLFFKTHRNCTSINNAPGGAHYIKIKYRVVDISEEFSNAGVDYTLSSSSYHGQYAHNADGGKQYNDSGQESGVC